VVRHPARHRDRPKPGKFMAQQLLTLLPRGDPAERHRRTLRGG
jgi:hypothetical protein